MQDTREYALNLMREIRSRLQNIHGVCASMDIRCPHVPLKLSFRPILTSDGIRMVRMECPHPYRHINILLQQDWHDDKHMPLIGVEAENLVYSVDPISLPEFVRWLESALAWLERVQRRVYHRAQRKRSLLQHPVGWFRSVLYWIQETLYTSAGW